MKVSITGKGTLALATRTVVSRFHEVPENPVYESDFLWICHDTPLFKNGLADAGAVLDLIDADLKLVHPFTKVIVSSQLPVGTTRRLEARHPGRFFACVPENIRAAHAIMDFEHQPRMVVGSRSSAHDHEIRELMQGFTQQFIFTTPETAELIKHALNTLLASTIAVINEISQIVCENGGDMVTVTKALRSDRRFNEHTPLASGRPFTSGNLEREVAMMEVLAEAYNIPIPMISGITASNNLYKSLFEP